MPNQEAVSLGLRMYHDPEPCIEISDDSTLFYHGSPVDEEALAIAIHSEIFRDALVMILTRAQDLLERSKLLKAA